MHSGTDRIRPRVTLSDVRMSLKKDVVAQDQLTMRLMRPLANLITPFFFNAGWSANGITLFRTVLSALAIAVLVHGESAAAAWAAAGFYLVYILDYVDGNLARLRDSASYWGKYIDGLSDNIPAMFGPFAAGVGLWLAGDAEWLLAAGAATTVVTLASLSSRYRLSFFREWMTAQTGALQTSDEEARAPFVRFEATLATIWINITFFTPLLLLVETRLYLIVMAAVCVPIEIVWIVSTLLHAGRILRRPKKSKYSV